jgi:hypothetical protein
LNGAIVQGEKDAVVKFLETKKPSTKKLNAGLHRAAAAGQADILGLPSFFPCRFRCFFFFFVFICSFIKFISI